MRISDWSSDVCSSDLRMRVAHLFRIGPFAISEGEIRRLQDRRRRIEQGFVIFGDHHVANADQGGGLGGLVRWGGCRPPQTASKCDKTVVFTATDRKGRQP